MKDDKSGANSLTRREALNIGLGTILGSAVATLARGRRTALRRRTRPNKNAWPFRSGSGRCGTRGPTVSSTTSKLRMAELVERGFNCIRIEGGAGITHDAEGRPRGELEFYPVLPGHGHFTRQMEHMTGGRVDLLQATDRAVHGRQTLQRQGDPLELVLPAHVLVHRQERDGRAAGTAPGETLHVFRPGAGPDPRRAETAGPGRHHRLRRDLQRGGRMDFSAATEQQSREVLHKSVDCTKRRWISCKRGTRISGFPWTPAPCRYHPRIIRATCRSGRSTATTCGLSTRFSSKT